MLGVSAGEIVLLVAAVMVAGIATGILAGLFGIGGGAGSVIAYFAPGAVFKIVFMVTVTIIAIKLLFGRDSWKIADQFPGQPAMAGYGFLVGITSSLMGVSGGSVSNMIQTLYGKPLHNAVATSSGLGVPITIAGTIGLMIAGWPQTALMPPLSIGYVSLLGVAIMAPVSSFTATHGALLAHRLSKRQLEIGFGLFLLLVSAR